MSYDRSFVGVQALACLENASFFRLKPALQHFSPSDPFPMKTCSDISFAHTRRGFLRQTSAGFGWLALAALNAQRAQAEVAKGYVNPLAPKPTHHAAKAKRVIFLYMQCGPSHMETFDFKPEML